MSAQESIGIFGDLVDDSDSAEADEVLIVSASAASLTVTSVPTVTDEDRAEFEADLKVLDGIIRRVENDFLNVGKWALDTAAKYGEEKYKALWALCRPDFSLATFENYIALAKFQRSMLSLYEQWRQELPRNIAVRMELSKTANMLIKRGESDPLVIDAAMRERLPDVWNRRKGKNAISNGDDHSGATKPSPLPANFATLAPGLQAMIDKGNLTDSKAFAIWSYLTGADYAAATICAAYGARDVAAVEALDKVSKSIGANHREQTRANVLAAVIASKGMFILADGDQIPLFECSGREIWAGYKMAVKEAEASGDTDDDDTEKPLRIKINDVDAQPIIEFLRRLQEPTNADQVEALLPGMPYFSITFVQLID